MSIVEHQRGGRDGQKTEKHIARSNFGYCQLQLYQDGIIKQPLRQHLVSAFVGRDH